MGRNAQIRARNRFALQRDHRIAAQRARAEAREQIRDAAELQTDTGQVVAGRPPNWDTICAQMGRPRDSFVITYWPKVYSLSGRPLTPDLIVHEGRHLRQQREIGGPEVWWDRWLADPAFRAEQEIECYRAQLPVIRAMTGRREYRAIVRDIARDLSGEPYGRCLTFQAAMDALQG